MGAECECQKDYSFFFSSKQQMSRLAIPTQVVLGSKLCWALIEQQQYICHNRQSGWWRDSHTCSPHNKLTERKDQLKTVDAFACPTIVWTYIYMCVCVQALVI
jgi:hypothetical protein